MPAIRRVTIVIPTLNGGVLLERMLDAVDAQDAPCERELVTVDSGSTDGTVDRLRARGAIVRQMSATEFNHGETRNAALAAASGELAVLLVQDAVPASRDWLRCLIEPFDQPDIAGSFGRQRARPDASRVTTHYLSSWIAAQETPRIAGPLTTDAFASLAPFERHSLCAFDNVCSCIRMDVWRKYPFKRTPIAEDLRWAVEVMHAGYRLGVHTQGRRVAFSRSPRSVRARSDVSRTSAASTAVRVVDGADRHVAGSGGGIDPAPARAACSIGAARPPGAGAVAECRVGRRASAWSVSRRALRPRRA